MSIEIKIKINQRPESPDAVDLDISAEVTNASPIELNANSVFRRAIELAFNFLTKTSETATVMQVNGRSAFTQAEKNAHEIAMQNAIKNHTKGRK